MAKRKQGKKEGLPEPKRWRGIGAIVAGFFTVFLLSLGTDMVLHAAGVFPGWTHAMSGSQFAFALAYRVVYTVLGGYVTARLAPENPMRHVLILGSIGLFAAVVGLLGTWNRPEMGPRWYPIALVVTSLPCVWAGGRLFMARQGAGNGKLAG